MVMKIGGVILAGGKSSRMQQDKRLLILNHKTFLQIAIEALAELNLAEIIISGDIQDKTYPNFKDINSTGGAIRGVCTILSLNKNIDYWLFVPVDMPKLKKTTFIDLLSQINNNKNNSAFQYINQVFPFIIKNNHETLLIISNLIKNKQYALKNMLIALKADNIIATCAHHDFTNVNYYDDFLNLNKRN